MGTTVGDLNDELKGTVEDINAVMGALRSGALAQIELPDINRLEGYTKKQFDSIIALAKEIQQTDFNFLEGQDLLTPDQAAQLIANAKPIFYDLGKEAGYQIAQGITDPKYIQQALQEAAQEGIAGLGYQFMSDVTAQQYASIMPQYQAIRNSIINQGGTSEETGLLTFFKDSTSPVYMKADWKIVQYLLQQILKTEEKQLDGIYNLPSGASFYVPFQAWKMDTETRQAMAGAAGGPVDVNVKSDLQPPVDKFGQYVEEFGGIFAGFIGKYSRENLTRKDEQLINELRLNEKWGKVGSPKEYNPIISPQEQQQQDAYEEFIRRFYAQKVLPKTPYVNEFGQPEGVPPRVPTEAPTLADSIKEAFKLSLPGLSFDLTDTAFAEAISNALAAPIDTLSTTIQNQINSLNSFIEQMKQGLGIGTGTTTPQTSIPQTNIPELKTALNLEVATQTQLIVDGRVLADILKPYLWNDLVTYQNSAGTTAGTFTAV